MSLFYWRSKKGLEFRAKMWVPAGSSLSYLGVWNRRIDLAQNSDQPLFKKNGGLMVFILSLFSILLGYIHCIGGIHCGNSKWPYIVHCLNCHLHYLPLSTPNKAIARDFIIVFHICIWNPSTICTHFHLLHWPSSSYNFDPHTVPILKSCLSFLIPKSVFKGVSQLPMASRERKMKLFYINN
jgi:hypothetical protein